MKLSEAMLPEFDHEMTNTRICLERVSDDLLTWKPHDKSMSMGQLANHIAEIPRWLTQTLATESLDLAPVGGEPWKPMAVESKEEILAAFDRLTTEAREALEAATDEQMMVEWSLLQGGQPFFTMPRIATIRSMVFNHLYHHRGQLSVYLRLNNLSVPAVYGPSADEQG